MRAKSSDWSCAMLNPEQSGLRASPHPLLIWPRPCSLTMRASIELKQHLPVVCSMQETQEPRIRMQDEQ